MPRRKFTRNKEDLKKVKEVIDKQHQEVEEARPPIVRDTGGSIANLKNKSRYFKKWVLNLQEKVNPLIGKHVESAPEYTVNPLMLDQDVEDMSDEMAKVLEKGAAEFNPDDDTFEADSEEVQESIKKDDDKSEKFIDISIVENITRKMSTDEDEKIEEVCDEHLKSYHNDSKYETKIPVKSVIENYRKILVLENKQSEKLLKKD